MRQINLNVRRAGVNIEDEMFDRATDFEKTSQYPAGLYGDAEFSLPRVIDERPARLQLGDEINVSLYTEDFWGLDDVYHGYVESIEEIRQGDKSETVVGLTGAWGWYMETRGTDKRWADTRFSEPTWDYLSSANGAEKAYDSRDRRIRITPKAEAWSTSESAAIQYAMPNGETVGRVTMNYDLQESGQAWVLRLWNVDDSSAVWSVSSSGTGSQAVTLSPASESLWLQFVSGANQTPTSDGTYYGEITVPVIYASRNHASATLGTVNAYQVALDIVDLLGVDVQLISAGVEDLDTGLTVSLVPFFTDGRESFAAILARAASFGDTSFEPIGYGLKPPFYAADNLPKLFLESYPDLSSFDYEISTRECDLSIRRNVDEVVNWVIVKYTDETGHERTLTPDDDSDLTDADSVAEFGRRERSLTIGNGNETVATSYGKRYLSRHKDPPYTVARPLSVTQLLARNGGWVPAPIIDAGKRLKIVDLPNLLGPESPVGKTFLITKATYYHARGEVDLSLGGVPDDLAIFLAQSKLRAGIL